MEEPADMGKTTIFVSQGKLLKDKIDFDQLGIFFFVDPGERKDRRLLAFVQL